MLFDIFVLVTWRKAKNQRRHHEKKKVRVGPKTVYFLLETLHVVKRFK